MKIYLASASPRRKELLRQVGISFKTMPSTIEEKTTKTEEKTTKQNTLSD